MTESSVEWPTWLASIQRGVETLPCGRWFDAVRVLAVDGERALAELGLVSAGVVEDQGAGTLCWLVPVGVVG
ncbi:hypothetical protein RM780_21365, partial [Streptomyces sp. DSM 44917]|nr:hypothetical protein [Streptomyces sp. DSM 44917]